MGSPAVALVAALAPRPAAAQTSGDVGVTIAPAFLHYLDVDPVCCPAAVWGAVGSGRWRAHVDYLRSTREDATLHEVNVLAAWRFLERDDSRAALLFGTNIRRGIRHQVGGDAGLAGRAPVLRARGRPGDKGSGRLVAASPGIPPAVEP